LGLLLFLSYVNDLPKGTVSKATHIPFADDTSILITSPNTTKLQNDINVVFKQFRIHSLLTHSVLVKRGIISWEKMEDKCIV
jgi:hypothetical protein